MPIGSERTANSRRNRPWLRITFRHQMSLGSDVVDALKVCRKGGMTEAAILAASDQFLDVISPNDARALVSYEKLRRENVRSRG